MHWLVNKKTLITANKVLLRTLFKQLLHIIIFTFQYLMSFTAIHWHHYSVRSEVLTAVLLKIQVLLGWECLMFQRIILPSSSGVMSHAYWTAWPSRWSQYQPLKLQALPTQQHSITSQNTWIFMSIQCCQPYLMYRIYI